MRFGLEGCKQLLLLFMCLVINCNIYVSSSSYKRVVLLNVVVVDNKHSRKSTMFELCHLHYQYTELHAPSPALPAR